MMLHYHPTLFAQWQWPNDHNMRYYRKPAGKLGQIIFSLRFYDGGVWRCIAWPEVAGWGRIAKKAGWPARLNRGEFKFGWDAEKRRGLADAAPADAGVTV